ncbi:unnamed protein product [Rhodiola kirilowii]
MSHSGSRVDDEEQHEDEQFELENLNPNPPIINNNNNIEGVPQVIYDDPEQLIRDQRRAQREAARQNQGAAGVQQGGGPAQQQVPARRPVRPPAQVQQQIRQQAPARQQAPPAHPRRHPVQHQVQVRQLIRRPIQPVYEDEYEEEAYYHDEEPSMGELSVPDFRDQSWCIYEGPELEEIAISTSIVHHLPKFSGAKGESATWHLKRYHGSCHNLRPYGASVDDFKLKAFYFSLTDSATDWFLSLPSASIYTWEEMQRAFLTKYYPAGRAMQVRRQLQELRQGPNETMYEYVEKFNALEKSCCNLGLPEKLLVEYMLDGLRRLDRKLLDASAGGNLMDLSPTGVRRKIMAVAESERFQDESTKEEEFSRSRNVFKAKPSNSTMAAEIRELKDMMQHVIRRQPVQARQCGFCAATDHKTDECPTVVEDDQAEVNAVGDYQGHSNQARPVRQYGSAGNGHGANRQPWRNDNHQTEPNHQYQQNTPGQYQQRGPNNNQPGPSNHGSSKSLEDMMKELAATVTQHMATTNGAIADLKKQVSQLATTVSELTNNAGRLPSQTIQNPKGNVSMVGVVDMTPKKSAYWEDGMLDTMARYNTEEQTFNPSVPKGEQTETDTVLTIRLPEKIPVLEAENPDTHNSSCYVQVITPEGNAIHKDELEDRLEARPKQNGPIMEHPLVTSHELPEKSKDPGAFTVTCGIGETQIHHCLIDLGAAINVMPYSLYCSLKLGPLKPPRLMIELGDRSCTRPDGLLENLTLRVGDLSVPADFYVLQMGDSRNDAPPALILGRPFLFSTKTRIDMGIGLLSLAFGGKTSDFYVYGDDDRPCTKKPPDIVHTSDYDALVPDPPEQTIQMTGPAAMAKKSSTPRRNVKANPPDRWRAESNTRIHKGFAQIEGEDEAKFDLTRPWDPNL